MPDFTYCDDDALHAESTKASSLTPNQFFKLCPGRSHLQFGSGGDGSSTNSNLGQPRCGDGSNFSFFFSRPLKQLSNDKKILIEFQGGGACWDEETCEMQQDYLTFPEYYNDFVGMSCSEIEYGAVEQNGFPLSLLCSKQIGSTDFREYNTIVVPYCTQDVHIGDNPNASYDGNNVIYHVGAHNMWRTLNWIFSNFKNPSHVFLTGCSAGGTAVPIAYDLINKHYNTFGPRAVNINSIMDSSVYLTPSYFLQNGFENWNPETIMKKKLRFNYNKYRYDENYPDLVWNHVLKRGNNRDRWGFVTHSSDPVSLMFYQYMSGNGNNDNGNRERSLLTSEATTTNRRMDNDLQSQWWSEISNSMANAKKKHRNVDTYVIESEGHCSFGLYYPLQEDGFEEWATPIAKEGLVMGNRRPSVASFFTSLAIGGILIFLTQRMKRERGPNKKEALMDNDSADQSESSFTTAKRVHLASCIAKVQDAASPILTKCQSFPWAAGYLLSTAIYFFSMLISQGFTHPLDNPALGPSAVGLSTFGINNPSLIVYQMEFFRLITASFLCSGFVTYLLMVYSVYKFGTGAEAAMADSNHHHWHFLLVAGLISFGINLIYAGIGKGASCASLALALGMNAFSATMHRRSNDTSFPSPLCFTIVVYIVGCTPLFPFDSLVVLTSAVVIGRLLGMYLFVNKDSSDITAGQEDDHHNENVEKEEHKRPVQVRWKLVQGIGAIYLMKFILLLCRVTSPVEQNLHPYFTGCNLVYSDQIGDFVTAYVADNGDGRALEGDDGSVYCAELCIPHLLYRPVVWGAPKFSSISLARGTCRDNGYEQHVADHTLHEYTVTFEVLLYTSSNGDNEAE